MFDVDTVFVIATKRGSYPVEDLLRAIRWSCTRSHYTVIVDRTPGLVLSPDLTDGFTVLRVGADNPKLSDDFLRGVGIRWAIDSGVSCRQFVGLDDGCMLIGRGLDAFLLDKVTRQGVGLLGVQDRLNYDAAFDKFVPEMIEMGLEPYRFQPDGSTVHGAFVAMSAELALRLFQQDLLVTTVLDHWQLPFGPFISWVTQLLGFYQVAWGQMDRSMPPLYVNHTERSQHQPPPHILSPSFLLYYSSRHAVGYSEEALREAYKLGRGEEGKRPEAMQPRISPKHDGPTVLG